MPAALTSETSHSRLTRWHLCLECVCGRTNKNAGRNSTLCREQKRAAFPKNSRKSGPKSRAQRFKSTDFAKTLFDIFFSDFKNWAQKSPEVVETSGLFALISFLVQLDGAGYGSRTRLLGLGSRCTTDVRILQAGLSYHTFPHIARRKSAAAGKTAPCQPCNA